MNREIGDVTDTTKATPVGPREMLDQMLPLLLNKDLNGFADLFAVRWKRLFDVFMPICGPTKNE